MPKMRFQASPMIHLILFFSGIILYAWALHRRDSAILDSPSGDYEPIRIKCPDGPALRFSDSGQSCLSDAEKTYVTEKASKSVPTWRKYLEHANMMDFNVNEFLSKAESTGGRASETLPSFGFALSGGSIRALCLGAAVLDAFDWRNEEAVELRVGGLLQLATYASGLSGGAWLLGSWATSNFPRLPFLNQTLWKLTEKNDLWDWNVAKDYPETYMDIKHKDKADFPITLVDAWGRILSRHFINEPDNGKGVLWSSIRETAAYKNRESPFVIVIALSRSSSHQPLSIESPIYEFTPEDFTVWNPRLNASIPIQFLGTPRPSRKRSDRFCVEGFDNAGFVMAMSSNIFSDSDGPQRRHGLVPGIMRMFTDDEDFEGKVPNTFQGLGASPPRRFADTDTDTLLMADGGLASENIPLFPLLHPNRPLDVIIAVDSTADGKDPAKTHVSGYPNGTSLYMTYRKTQLPEYSSYHFPGIPNAIDGTFARLGYNKRPTFFGCYDKAPTPIVIYLPNYNAVADTDSASSQTTYSGELIGQFFANGFAIATQSKGRNQDPEWSACLACAIIDRQLIRNTTPRTAQCDQCFKRYCAKP